MADTTSTTQFKADISQLKSAMQAAQRQVRLASSEFQKASAGLDDWSSSATGLQAKIKQLNSTLSAQKKQVELANEEWEKTVKVYGENSAEADRAKMKLNGYEAAVAKTEKQLNQYTQELKDCEEGTGRFADETEDLDTAVSQVSDGFTTMKGVLANLVADGIRLAIDAVKELGRETLQAGMDFESGMAQVAAVSGASSEELELLTEKAKEMGAKTKFSATESAEAFNYMAMAGWSVEDMLDGIEGLMNLAAASGSDLATTSDIVTDALTAMGYSASDAGRLADVMAAASSNANTNVEMMGQTFQYAAPIIGALGYNMEDAAVQIGLMANAGIKGEKAGTALRSILTRLSAPPKECADAMEELGISMTDSEGNMKSLDEIMGDLRKAFNELNETEQTSYAKHIAGQEAMSGLLAIVNAAPADYEKLTKAVNESSGAAEKMADTMNDTVEGQLTLLKSQIEGIQIQIYEKLTPALRDGLDKVSETLEGIDWGKVGDKLGDFAAKAIDLFVKIIDNADGIIEVVKSIGTVLVATFVINKIAGFAQMIAGLVTTFRTLKTATDAATTSQKLLNLAQAVTPIGAITAAVAGLATGLIYFMGKTDETKEKLATLTEFEQEQVDKVYELSQAYNELSQARDEQVAGINAEFQHYEDLATELDGLVDANGRVKEGYEDRVNFILTTLNEAVGTEMELVDGVIQNYQDEKAAIEQLIETKKAEAILSANEEAYTTAIQNRDEALQNYITTQGIYAQNKSDLAAAEEKYQNAMSMTSTEYAKLHGLESDLGTASRLLANEQSALADELSAAQGAVGESRRAMQLAEDTYVGYQSTIQNYEGLSSAIISGDADKINAALTNMQYNFITAETGTRESLERQVRDMEANYKNLQAAVDSGSEVVTKEMVDEAKGMVEASKKELDKFGTEGKKSVDEGMREYTSAMKAKKGEVVDASKEVTEAGAKKMDDPKAFKKSGENNGQGYIDGLLNKQSSINSTAGNLGTGSINKLNDAIDAHSPSKKTTNSGEYFGQGFINGMNNKASAIYQKAYELGQKAVKAIREAQQEGSPSKLTFISGVNFSQGYINGIASMQGELQKTVKKMTTVALKQAMTLDNFDFSKSAQNAADYLSKELSDKTTYMINKANNDISKALNELQTDIDNLTAEKAEQTKYYDERINGISDEDIKAKLKREKAKVEAYYDDLIAEQKKVKEDYQTASSEMIKEFTTAVNEYSSQAQQLINDTINGVSNRYQEKYDALIDKQNSLISKLKSAGDLFEISGAGIMTVNDINEQTKQIKEYTAKLAEIKKKVSADLFDEIASYDMKEGSAFIDRLLALSDADLKAYSQAYDEKMSVAEKLSESIYKSDFDTVAKDYKNELNKAFKDLPKQLETIGNDTMKGFVEGLTKNTDYMTDQVQDFVASMVETFKDELKIKSPSRVMMAIGDFTGEGFVDGLKNTINNIKKTAKSMAETVATPLSSIKSNMGSMKAAVGDSKGLTSQTTNVVNNYNLTQNNISPKSLSALETYQARRQQLAMVKAMT